MLEQKKSKILGLTPPPIPLILIFLPNKNAKKSSSFFHHIKGVGMVTILKFLSLIYLRN